MSDRVWGQSDSSRRVRAAAAGEQLGLDEAFELHGRRTYVWGHQRPHPDQAQITPPPSVRLDDTDHKLDHAGRQVSGRNYYGHQR